jgi:hypothetical protein
MALTLKTSIATPTANSYISIASADEYFEARQDSDAWDKMASASTGTLSATQRKTNLLVQAAREMDRTFRFYGSKYNTGQRGASDYQALEFPRIEDTDDDGNPIIRYEIQYAQCEQAIWLMQRSDVQTREDGTVIEQPKFSNLAYDYIKPNITRTVSKSGKYPWEKSGV